VAVASVAVDEELVATFAMPALVVTLTDTCVVFAVPLQPLIVMVETTSVVPSARIVGTLAPSPPVH
jgi:hypothetical protein